MKNNFGILVLSLFSAGLLSAGIAFGEPAAPTPPPAPLPTPRAFATAQPSYINMMEIKADIAEHNYQTDPKPANLSEYINQEQQLLAATCFGDLLTTLQYPGFPEAQSCRDSIKKILDLDSANPIAQCVQNGIDSELCRDASSREQIGAYNVTGGSWTLEDHSKSGHLAQIDLQTALQEKAGHKQMAELEHAAEAAWSEVHLHPGERYLLDDYEIKLQHVLKFACVNTKYALELPPTPTPEPTLPGQNGLIQKPTRAAAADPDDPFAKVLNSIDQTARPITTPTPVVFKGASYAHYRLLPIACLRNIKRGATLLPSSPVIICYRDGATAPSCIDARRRAATVHKSQQKSSHVDGNSISDF